MCVCCPMNEQYYESFIFIGQHESVRQNMIIDNKNARQEQIYALENDTMCGVPTGGKDECFWDCIPNHREFSPNVGYKQHYRYYVNPECLKDCFPEKHCVNLLLDDYVAAGGACYNFNQPWLNISQNCENGNICSKPTKAEFYAMKLKITDCHSVYKMDQIVANTWWTLWKRSCNKDITCKEIQDYLVNVKNLKHKKLQKNILKRWLKFDCVENFNPSSSRLNPIRDISKVKCWWNVDNDENCEEEDALIRTEPEFENTKHRYPWICSLQRKDSEKRHLCAVTLLRRPPGPTVMVTTAHCTLICRSDIGVVPNCCCENVSGRTCSNSTVECGENPKSDVVTGEEAQIVCGEWEIGNTPQVESGEVYNVILSIKVRVVFNNENCGICGH